MLHPLKPPDRQCEDDLFSLIEWQRRMLIYLRDNDQFRLGSFRQFMGDNFADWFDSSRNSGLSKQEKAFNKFKQNLEAFVKCDVTEKQLVLEDFEWDQNFYFHLDDPSFLFAFSRQKSTAHQYAKECLNAFYEFLTWSIPGSLLASRRNFHRQDIVQSYIAQNPVLLSVCPCCDNSWPEPKNSQEKPQTLEHFFHKEEHPTLCLHPYNLIPVCGVCNERRGNKEMLSPNGGAILSMNQIFYPLERPACNYAQLEFRSRRLEPEVMSFVNSPKRIDDWQIAIDTYEAVYEIPSRWRASWSEIENTASQAILHALQASYRVGGPISRERFSQELELIERTLMQNYGRYQYPAGRWLAWAKANYLDQLYQAHVESRSLQIPR